MPGAAPEREWQGLGCGRGCGGQGGGVGSRVQQQAERAGAGQLLPAPGRGFSTLVGTVTCRRTLMLLLRPFAECKQCVFKE